MDANTRLTPDEYGAFVVKGASPHAMTTIEAKLGLGGLGVAGEAGEVADIVKKVLYHGVPFDESMREKFKKENGDALWYIVYNCYAVLGITLADLIQANVEKLIERHGTNGFNFEAALAKERAKDQPKPGGNFMTSEFCGTEKPAPPQTEAPRRSGPDPLDKVVTFGKYKGTPIGRLPPDYITWVYDNLDIDKFGIREGIEIRLGKRKPGQVQAPKPEFDPMSTVFGDADPWGGAGGSDNDDCPF